MEFYAQKFTFLAKKRHTSTYLKFVEVR